MAVDAVPHSLDESLTHLVLESDTTLFGDAPRILGQLREQAPVHRVGPIVLVSRHQDVRTALIDSDRRYSRGEQGTRLQSAAARLTPEQLPRFHELMAFERRWMSRNPSREDHDRLRRIAHRAFTPRRLEAMRPVAEAYADELLTELAREERPDVASFAYRFPLMVIAEMLGVPREDHDAVHEWSRQIGRALARDPEGLMIGHQGMSEFVRYTATIAERHRRDPTSVSELVAAMLDAEEEERLTPDELAAMFVQLLFAGHETTTNLLAIGTVELLRHRDQWQLLCNDPSLTPGAVEELLRLVTPVQFVNRNVASEFELDGVTLPQGQTVFLVLAAANRDPDVFSAPETLDITRPDSGRHLAFGYGFAFCLGASLTRLEADIAFRELARRFPALELATDELDWQGFSMLRSLKRVPVRLGSRP